MEGGGSIWRHCSAICFIFMLNYCLFTQLSLIAWLNKFIFTLYLKTKTILTKYNRNEPKREKENCLCSALVNFQSK